MDDLLAYLFSVLGPHPADPAAQVPPALQLGLQLQQDCRPGGFRQHAL
jgi:hypothetical protein